MSIGNRNYTESELYEFYPKSEWQRLGDSQKSNLLNDYIRRSVAVLETKELNLHRNPSVAIKLRNRNDKFLVNRAYEQFVAMPLIDPDYLELGRKNISREILVSHILIGYEGSELPGGFSRSKDEAYQLASSILTDLNDSSMFSEVALQHSEDPGVKQNKGQLGWIYWGKVDPDFQKEVFQLEAGSVSDPILTKFGYHIVYIEEERESEAAVYTNDKKEERVNYASMGSVRHLLKDAADNYDRELLDAGGFALNDQLLEDITEIIVSENSRSTYMNNVDLVPVFEDLQITGVVAVFGGKGYGLSWFINRMKKSAPSKRPQMTDKTTLKHALRTFVLQYHAERLAKEKGLDGSFGFKAHTSSVEKEVYYNSFIRYLVNNAPEPTQSQMMEYYEQNKSDKYVDLEKVSVRNLKVKTKPEIEKLYEELKGGADFDELAKNHSLINRENGGKMQPFDKSTYKIINEALKGLSIGEYTEPFETRDRHWAVVILDDVLPEKILPFDRVKTRIKTALKKINQDNHKEDTFNRLKTKYHVTVNPSFYKYPES